MIQVGFLVVFCIAAVTAQPKPPAAPAPATAAAPCVTAFKPVTPLDPKKLDGIFYEVRRINSVPDRQGTCEVAKYKVNDAGTETSVDLHWLDGTGAKKQVTGSMQFADPKSKAAILNVKLGDKSAAYTIFHLADTFFGVYSCIANQGYVWVFAKTFEVTDQQIEPLTKAVTAAGVDTKLLKVSVQGGCPDFFA